MPYKSVLPKVKDGIIAAVVHEFKDLEWAKKTWERINDHDPIMGAYFKEIESRWGKECACSALLVYRILESQIEADQMNSQFGDEDV